MKETKIRHLGRKVKRNEAELQDSWETMVRDKAVTKDLDIIAVLFYKYL